MPCSLNQHKSIYNKLLISNQCYFLQLFTSKIRIVIYFQMGSVTLLNFLTKKTGFFLNLLIAIILKTVEIRFNQNSKVIL